MISSAKLRREVRRLIYGRPDVTRKDRAVLAGLQGKFAGKRCFVIGNGPSLCVEDLHKIARFVTFASNKIYLIFDQTDWRPDFYTIEDGLVMRQNHRTVAALDLPCKLMPNQMIRMVPRTPDMTVFSTIAPSSWETPLDDPAFPVFSDDLQAGIAWGSTVVYTQIQIAAAMGFAEICLVGVDHRYELGRELGGNVLESRGEVNHFHPEYRPKGEKWHAPKLDVLEVSYARAREETERRGIRLVNCSRQTALTCLERAPLESFCQA